MNVKDALKLDEYLIPAVDDGVISFETYKISAILCFIINYHYRKMLPPPDACVYDGGLMLTWDNSEHHWELEIEDSGNVEAFYRNRRTGEMMNAVIDDNVKWDIFDKLKYFLSE